MGFSPDLFDLTAADGVNAWAQPTVALSVARIATGIGTSPSIVV